jgi:branched-chain amino acid transport system ATP-binding protein
MPALAEEIQVSDRPDAILETRSLSVHYGGVAAVDAVSLAVRPGEIFGLLGPNGAGKTTLLAAIAGAVRSTAGEVRFRGEPVTALRPDQLARRGMARTFQITRPFEDLTVEENVMVGAQPRCTSLGEMRAQVAELVDWVGLGHKRHDLAKGLSTGQRKRLELARALATRPVLLLMDEVSGGLDQPSVPALIELVARVRASGVTVVLIEHNMRIISELCDRVMFLDRGRQLAEGAPRAVMAMPAVVDLYLGSGGAHA